MAVQIQVRRGSTAEHSTFTGAVGEITMDTTKNVVVVHNGSIVGGFPLALASGSAITAASLLVNNNLNISTGNAYQINGVSVLSATTLGSGVTASSLTSVGTLTALTVSGDLTVDTSTLKVDSANNHVGIGTASPGATLHVNAPNGNNTNIALSENDSIKWFIGNVTGASTFRFFDNTAGAERMRLDASGNLGLGVTPNAGWDANRRVLQVGGSGAVWSGASGAGTFFLSNNAYFDGASFRYLHTSSASFFAQMSDGGFQFASAASGTAGDAITFTEKMRLDVSGNLGVGVTPSAWETASSKALQFTGGSIWSFSTSQLNLLQNAFYNTSGNLTYINNAAASAYRQISGAHSWYTAGAGTGTISFGDAKMTLDASGNLGLGTASPGYALDVVGGSATALRISGNSAATNNTAMRFYGLNAAADLWAIGNAVSTNDATRNFDIYDLVAGANRLRLDASGNLGVGATPSAWGGAINQVVQLGRGVSLASQNNANVGYLFSNAYFDGSFRYFGSGFATAFVSNNDNGSFQWRTAPSGTAGNAITFTQAMTLDASGNLTVGTTSAAGTSSATPLYLTLGNTFASTAGDIAKTKMRVFQDNAGNIYGLGVSSGLFEYHVPSSAGHAWYVNNTERARIDASGNLGVGVTPTQKLDVALSSATTYTSGATGNGLRLYNTSTTTNQYVGITLLGEPSAGNGGLATIYGITTGSGNMDLAFSTRGSSTLTERARITAGGYTKHSNNGTYLGSTGSFHEFYQSNIERALALYAADGLYTSSLLYGQVNSSGTGFKFISWLDNGGEVFQVRGDGNVYNTFGTYGTLSDAKLKQDITDAGSSWDDLKAVRFRKYRFKSDVEAKGEDAPYLLGVVAQELQATSPGLVDSHPDTEQVEVEVEVEKSRVVMHEVEEVVTDAEGVESVVMKSVPMLDEDGKEITETYTATETRTETRPTGTETLSVKQSILLMKAAVALQEAMARIEALEAEVVELKK